MNITLMLRSPLRFAAPLLIAFLLLSGCSGSGDSPTQGNTTSGSTTTGNTTVGENLVDDEGPGTEGESPDDLQEDSQEGVSQDDDPQNESDNGTTDGETINDAETDPAGPVTPVPATTQVKFDITVPAYVSDSLQVRLAWDTKDQQARWVTDELWTLSAELPTNKDLSVLATFYDQNGAVTLGTAESNFTTGTNPSETYEITADQFDTSRWDSDGDGVSNFNESIMGTNPLGDDPVESVQANLELVADKTFHISWQSAPGASFYRVLENADGVSGYSQISSDLDSSIQHFDHRVALYARVNARYIVQGCNSLGCVDSDEQTVSGNLQSAIGYFKASNPEESDAFGTAVSLSADGYTLAVGAPGEDSAATRINRDQTNNDALNSGAVYIFEWIDGTWAQQAYVKASNTDQYDRFGEYLALSADGETLAVGTTDEDSAARGVNGNQNDDSMENSGAVYVFVRTADIWRQQAYLKASNGGSRHSFGQSISLSENGNTLAVGAPYEGGSSIGINGDQENQTTRYAGAVYVFVRQNETWQQQAYLKASNTDIGDAFGTSLSVSSDGNTLAIGAKGEQSSAIGVNGNQLNNTRRDAGAVYLFVRIDGNWQQQAYVKATNTGSVDYFAHALALSGDGNTLAVGAIWEDSLTAGVNANQNDNSGREVGAVYVYAKSGNQWIPQAYLKASNPDDYDMFGYSLGLSDNGDKLAIGAFREGSSATGINGDQHDNEAPSTGAVYTFVRSNGSWQQEAYLKPSNPNTGSFGSTLSLNATGDALAVGGYYDTSAAVGFNGNQSDNSAANSGAAYLY